MAPSIRPTIGMPMARATMVTCAVFEPSSSTTPRSLRRSYSSRSAAPRLRATRMVSSGRPAGSWLSALPTRWRKQAVGDVVEVDQPLAQVGVAGVADAHAGLLLDPADRGLGGQAGADRLADAPQPAGVLREHAVGLEHLALLAADRDRWSPASGRAPRAARRSPDRGARARPAGSRPGGGSPRRAARAARPARSPPPRPAGHPSSRRIAAASAVTSAYLLWSISSPDAEHLGQDRGDDLHRLDLVLGIGAGAPGSARSARPRPGRRAGSARPGTSGRSPRAVSGK